MKLVKRDEKYLMTGVWIEATRFRMGPFSWLRFRYTHDRGEHTLTTICFSGIIGKIFGGWRPPAWFADLLWADEKVTAGAEIVENPDDTESIEVSFDV